MKQRFEHLVRASGRDVRFVIVKAEEDGWELVAVTDDNENHAGILFFKRPFTPKKK